MSVSPWTPVGSDLALLRVVTAASGDVGRRWGEWAAAVDIDHLSPDAYGLLPALYRRLEAEEVEHPWVARLRGVYRRHWTECQLRRAAAESLVSTLAAAEIEALAPGDQQVAALLADPTVAPLDRPRVAVDWWAAPAALDALVAAGWRVDDQSDRRSVRARLGRVRWGLTGDAGEVDLVTFFHPSLVDAGRDRATWERARAAGGPPRVSEADLAAFALLFHGSGRWVMGTIAALEASSRVDLRPVLAEPAARGILPGVAARLELLRSEGLAGDVSPQIEQVAELARRHPLPHTFVERARDRVRRRVVALRRQPRAAVELVSRYGGVKGARSYLRRY